MDAGNRDAKARRASERSRPSSHQHQVGMASTCSRIGCDINGDMMGRPSGSLRFLVWPRKIART
jgi:hypothetical protein